MARDTDGNARDGSDRRDCLNGYQWCDGPDGETVDGEAFGGLCGDCHIKKSREGLGKATTDT
jgi:hypothetical protein